MLPQMRFQSPERTVAGNRETFSLLFALEHPIPIIRVIEVPQSCCLNAMKLSQLFTRRANLGFYFRFRIVFSFRFHRLFVMLLLSIRSHSPSSQSACSSCG